MTLCSKNNGAFAFENLCPGAPCGKDLFFNYPVFFCVNFVYIVCVSRLPRAARTGRAQAGTLIFFFLVFFVCAQAGTLDYQLNNPP